jgi:hypothetical protein
MLKKSPFLPTQPRHVEACLNPGFVLASLKAQGGLAPARAVPVPVPLFDGDSRWHEGRQSYPAALLGQRRVSARLGLGG